MLWASRASLKNEALVQTDDFHVPLFDFLEVDRNKAKVCPENSLN
jgi:hypothetical protein